jgi:hydrogenase maturation factor
VNVTLTPEMCLGTIERLVEVWDEDGARLGRAKCGAVLSLAFAPDAVAGSHVVAHAGLAVRTLDPESAADAAALREAMSG